MKTIDNQGLVELLKCNNDIAYVATAITPWHAIGVVASIMSQKLEDKRGIVLIIVHSTFGKLLIDDSNFSQLGDNIEVYIYTVPSSKEKAIILLTTSQFILQQLNNKKQERELFILSFHSINILMGAAICNKISNLRVHMLYYDEGLATYFPYQKVEPYKGLFNAFGRSLDTLYRRIYMYYRPTINACMFINDKQEIGQNNYIIPYYRDSITTSGDDKLLPNLELFEDSIIICPNAWTRSEVDNNVDCNLVLRLVDNLYKNNIKFIIKLHPRDDWSRSIYYKYSEFILEDTYLSMEAILSKLHIKPKALVGFSSTILVTAKLFWEIPTINIADLVENKYISKIYWNEKYYFSEIFGSYVSSPKSFDDLLRMLR